MKFFFAYLWRSPLIRLSIIWFLIAIAGISVFAWRLTGMRQELILTNKRLQSHIEAMHQIEAGQNKKKRTEIDEILEDIERYRPSVEELLSFVKIVEEIANKNKVYLFFHTIKTTAAKAKQNENYESYKAGFTGSIDQIQSFMDEFELLPYATNIESIDILQSQEGQYILRLIFIIYTKIS